MSAADEVWFPWFLILAVSPILLIFAFCFWNGRVRPRFIPQREIDGLVDLLIARHGDNAEEAAAGEEFYHWRDSDEFQHGKWRRIRREIARRSREAAQRQSP